MEDHLPTPILRGTIQTESGSQEMVLIRAWPTTESDSRPAEPSSEATGTGFLIATDGLIATNWHVIDKAKNLSVSFRATPPHRKPTSW